VSEAALARLEALEQRLRERDCAALLEARLAAATNLPQTARDYLRKEFGNREFDAKDLDEAIASLTSIVASVDPTGQVQTPGRAGVTQMITEGEKLQAALDQMLGVPLPEADRTKFAGVKAFRSLREAYVRYTDDPEVRGMYGPARLSKLQEELTTASFTYALGTSMTRRLVRDYQAQPALWRVIATVERLDNFKTQERVRWGGYGDLATVSEGASYTEFTDPSDQEATYTPIKRGNLVSITREVILNDDLALIRKIPGKIARAALRTLEKFVWVTNLQNNPTVYDGVALFHSSHNNLGSSALSYTTLWAGITAMRKQTESGSNERIGIMPKFLVGPVDLAETILQLTASELKPGEGTTTSFNDINAVLKALELTPLVVPWLTDTNNWYLIADPTVWDTFEIGFVGGQEEPELVLQDNATSGSVFTADKITYKIRHEYGGAWIDYRSAYGAVVA